MSDLQCPATFYVRAPAPEEQVPLPVGSDDERIVLVWSAPSRLGLARRLAAELGCDAREDEDLAGDVVAALEALSDLHRGESVVALPAGAYPGHPAGAWLRVRIDADGTAVTVVEG
ncbi:hypothetical protein BJY21_000756 [Kineosphaera limosa]|uniref:Uncharacterized protein n=1 Tax=Kineosphaera limosa NBRC 100340 TaxID=1184609 RepID=K6WU94_9MICO|nr:hypothetical protein [Kineosphaera limosa]NYD99571.1 hypothetical protein [Kineosphaera limosa]GAB95672.1 hypothetical protein KILIM_025_00080 [Kineosphaera limosa NBRC 100340]